MFFVQSRNGYNHRVIRVAKFRSMTVAEDGDVVTQAVRGDKRVTRVGRFLRRTSLDELPQLFNVLRGELSLVGPRPHAVAHNESYTRLLNRYANRHKVKPGITGWAAVNGLPRRDKNARRYAPARRDRPLLHQELVAVARHSNPGPYRACTVLQLKCLLTPTKAKRWFVFPVLKIGRLS